MSLWYQSPEYDDGSKPCVNVLIFGTSKYKNLPDAGQDSSNDPKLLGLTSVTTPAISAYRFANWIKNSYRHPDLPLGSIRLLLSPSSREIEKSPELSALNQPIPNKVNIENAIGAWRDDCCKHRDSCAIMYAGGHGIRLGSHLGVVLLEDFGDGLNTLDGAIDIGSIHQGMVLNAAAKNQFYFIDACAISSSLFRDYSSAKVGVTLDHRRNETLGEDGGSPIFFAAASETPAFGDKGEGTVFIQALLKCLEYAALRVDDWNNPTAWQVKSGQLVADLRECVLEEASVTNDSQWVVCGGINSDAVFHQVSTPPKVPLSVSVVPEQAQQDAHYKLTEINTDLVKDELEPFKTPREKEVTAGVYKITFQMKNGSGYSDQKVPWLIVEGAKTTRKVEF